MEDVQNLMRLEHRITGKYIAAVDVDAAAERARVPAVYGEIFPEARKRIVKVAENVEHMLKQQH